MPGGVKGSWHKSTRCGESGHCVEVASLGQDVGLRSSIRPHEILTISPTDFREFLDRIKTGELDYRR